MVILSFETIQSPHSLSPPFASFVSLPLFAPNLMCFACLNPMKSVSVVYMFMYFGPSMGC